MLSVEELEAIQYTSSLVTVIECNTHVTHVYSVHGGVIPLFPHNEHVHNYLFQLKEEVKIVYFYFPTAKVETFVTNTEFDSLKFDLET